MRHRELAAGGFTLIELLATIAIVGILIAIAIPQYAEYKKRGFDTRAKVDLRNVAIAEEAHFIDTESYLSCADAGCTALPGIATLSQGVTLAITATATGFTGTSTHSHGSGIIFRWNSDLGGLQ